MRPTNSNIKPTVVIAGAATFGALAALISLLAPPVIQPSFPILFYLKFDIAEIVDITAFLIFGPVAGLVTGTVHATILTAAPGGAGPFGASLKFLAVLSTYGGLIIASKLGKHKLLTTGSIMTVTGVLTRVVVMTLVNYLYLIVLAQVVFGVNYSYFAQLTLSQVGVSLTGTGFVLYILGLTAIFNAIHAIFSIVVSLVLVNAILSRAPQLVAGREWIRRTLTIQATAKGPSVLPNDRSSSDSGTAGNGP
jgi:riboflavin transporter FmnP